MSSAPPPQPSSAEIARDATWLVQAIDPGAGLARLVRMSAEDYRASSFLDDRMLQEPRDSRLVPLAALSEAAALVEADDARWIFHIGHVGSTLIARLLGELPQLLSVREPRSLRDIAVAPALVDPLRRLFARSFAPSQVALVKATSFVSEIAPQLIGARGKALFLIATPRNYIASILAGENSLRELQALAPSRAQRLAARVPSAPKSRSEADLAALAWACEMTSLEAAADALPDAAILWLDFDQWLPSRDLAPIADSLGLGASPEELTKLKSSPLHDRYSKALDYDYSAALRQELIDHAGEEFGRDIAGALAMLAQAAESAPLLARALNRFGGR